MDFKKFKAATVQTSPVFLNVEKTIDKAITFIKEASANGAQLIAFPEVFVAGYPYWNWIMTPVQGSKWYEELYKCSVAVTDESMQPLFHAAKENNIHIVIGINERGDSYGEIYNTNLIIDNNGILIGKHRKLVPTWAEKLTWTSGDGSSLKVYNTEIGPIGTLACGENTNTLARFTLLSQGELIHIANYISLPVAPPDYNMAEAIKIRAAAHSFEGKLFTIVSCSTISQEINEAYRVLSNPDLRKAYDLERESQKNQYTPNNDDEETEEAEDDDNEDDDDDEDDGKELPQAEGGAKTKS